MNNYYAGFIQKLTDDIRFKDINLSLTEDRRKCYKHRKELEVKILRIVMQINVNNDLFLRTTSFRINHIIEEDSTEVVTNLGYVKKNFQVLDYKKISLFIYESINDLKRKDLSIREVL